MKKIKSLSLNYYQQQIAILMVVIIPTLVLYILVIKVGILITHLSAYSFIADPFAVAKLPPYIGLFSNLGVLIWCSCVTICIVTYFILKKKMIFRKYAGFLLWSGILTFLLMIDDLFMLHEVFGKHGLYIYIIYIIITVGILMKYLNVIAKTEFIILLGAMVCFALSIFIDVLDDFILKHHLVILEDSFKYVGIVCWFTYFIRLAWEQINLFIDSHPVATKINPE
jgi:hypothetical protein